MRDFKAYIDANLAAPVVLGKSGASVYELTGGRIAKHVRRQDVPDGSKWQSYENEAAFYEGMMAGNPAFLPDILHCRRSEEEIQLIMRRYRPLERRQLDDDMLDRIMQVLGQIHRMPMETNAPAPQLLDDAQLAQCADGWRAVLAEHGASFAADGPEQVAACINELNRRHHSGRVCRCHGDFHVENLLLDDAGHVIVCDWQSTRAGHPAEDIAFFISRLDADGCAIDREKLIGMYCRHADGIAPQEIDVQMRLANLNTTFVFWHWFLRGAAEDAVRRVYEPMLQDVQWLMRI